VNTVSPPSTHQIPAPQSQIARKVDALFESETKKGNFAGSVVVVDGGDTVFTKGYGEADREGSKDNTADTIFRIGSLTKQFTAAAILALASEGKLHVNDPLARFIPEYPKKNLVRDGVEVTLHHLLSHTSGLPDARETEYFKNNVWRRPIDSDRLLAQAKLRPLVRTPGTKFEYLNSGYLLLGVVIERVSKTSYDSFLRSRFFTPLGMRSTGTLLPADLRDRAAVGYYRAESGGLLSMAREANFGDRDVTFAFGSGQIYSSAGDLARWEHALQSQKVQGENLLFTPNLEGYGYGWTIEDVNGVQRIWHNGALSPLGFSCLMVRVPSKKRMIAFLSNFDTDLTEDIELKVADLALAD
jgi:D-alanyl-D-alanine carboxypeptidase